VSIQFEATPIAQTCLVGYIPSMAWEVEYTDEFEAWWITLDEREQESVDIAVTLLEEKGPRLPFPFSSKISNSRYGHMRELRIQHHSRPYQSTCLVCL
jgi:hypothetical protein